MSAHQITAIRKPNRYSTHEHITHVRYDGFVHTREEVIRLITLGLGQFYTLVNGAMAWVKVVRPSFPRQPFIQTIPDRTGRDNLLSLPEC